MDLAHSHLNIQAYSMFPYRVVNMYNTEIHIGLTVEFYLSVYPIRNKMNLKNYEAFL